MPIVILDLVESRIVIYHQEALDSVVGVYVNGQGGLDKVKQVFLGHIFGQIYQLRVILYRF